MKPRAGQNTGKVSHCNISTFRVNPISISHCCYLFHPYFHLISFIIITVNGQVTVPAASLEMFQMTMDSESVENEMKDEAESTTDDSFVRQDSFNLDEEVRVDYSRSVSDEFRQTWTNSFRRRTNTVRKLIRNFLGT